MGGWKILGERDTRVVRKDILEIEKSCSDSKMRTWLHSHHLGWARIKRV